jgi:hypothetical protein
MKSEFDSVQNASELSHAPVMREIMVPQPNPAALDVRYEVAFQIGHSVPEVKALYSQLEGRILRVWTVVAERDDAIYRKIYAREKEIIKAFDGMEFEFNVIPAMGRSLEDVVPDPSCTLVYEQH